MTLIGKLNLNYLRVFEAVYRSRSMTKAATELHLTQSGVSQQVKLLEGILKVTLFDRVGRTLVPTGKATELFAECDKGFAGIEGALRHIVGDDLELGGTLTIGAPAEFGHNLVLPELARFAEKHPKVRFRVRIGLAAWMNELLLSGEADFAFVDTLALDPRLETRRVYDEVLELCIAQSALKRFGRPVHEKAWYQQIPYVEYLEGEPFLRMWFRHHLPGAHIEPEVRAYMMDSQGIAQLIAAGTGAGVLPGHLVERLKERGEKIHCVRGRPDPLRNAISVAVLKGRTQSRVAVAALSWVRDALARAQSARGE